MNILGEYRLIMKRIFLTILLVLVAFVVESKAEDLMCRDVLNFDLPNDEADYSLTRLKTLRKFTTWRGYKLTLGLLSSNKIKYPWYGQVDIESGKFSLRDFLNSMDVNDSILNVGCGDGLFETEVIQTNFKGNVFGLDLIPMNKNLQIIQDYSHGRINFLLDETIEERFARNETFGITTPERFKLILNAFASDTYSEQLYKSVEIQLKLLEPNGVYVGIIPTSSFLAKEQKKLVATRIRPTSADAIERTHIQQRVIDYLRMSGLPARIPKNLQPLQISKFPKKTFRHINESDGSEKTVSKDDKISSTIHHIVDEVGGIIGWLENIKGIKLIALDQPSEEEGILFVFRRTADTEIEVPKLNQVRYQYETGPPLRFYEW